MCGYQIGHLLILQCFFLVTFIICGHLNIACTFGFSELWVKTGEVVVQGQELVCHDFNITETSGIITSPGDETRKMYPTELECFLWVFDVEVDHVVELTFHTIDVEVSEDCYSDFVSIFTVNLLMFVFCGSYIPPTFTMKEELFAISYVTDTRESHGGFNLTYAQNSDAHGCFITYNKGYGHISTPVDTDGYYFDNMDCTWTILSSVGGGSISLYIMEMDIRSNYMFPCEQDYIELQTHRRIYSNGISEGNLEDSSITLITLIRDDFSSLGIHCGWIVLPPLTTLERAIILTFHSDDNDRGRGFFAYYAITEKDIACGGMRTESIGVIRFDTYLPKEYGMRSCFWLLIAPKGSQIQLRFLDFSMKTNCQKESLLISEYNVNTSTLHCGYGTPEPLLSSANVLLLLYRAKGRLDGERFSIEFIHITAGKETTIIPTTYVDDIVYTIRSSASIPGIPTVTTMETHHISQVAEDSITTQVVEDSSITQVAEDSTIKQVTEDSATTQVAEDSTSTQVAEDSTNKQVTEDSATTQMAEETTATQVAENSTTTQLTDDSTTAQVADDSTSSLRTVSDNITSTVGKDNETTTASVTTENKPASYGEMSRNDTATLSTKTISEKISERSMFSSMTVPNSTFSNGHAAVGYEILEAVSVCCVISGALLYNVI